MLPRLVGGAEWSLTVKFLLSPTRLLLPPLLAELHDQLLKLSTAIGGAPPLVKAGGVVGRECGCEAGWIE